MERLRTLLADTIAADPDTVGSSEYRAILECIEGGLASQDAEDPDASPTELVEAMLGEFISHAEALLRAVAASKGDTDIGPCILCGTQCVPGHMTEAACPNPDCDTERETYWVLNCAKCGVRIEHGKSVVDVDAFLSEWHYCSSECRDKH